MIRPSHARSLLGGSQEVLDYGADLIFGEGAALSLAKAWHATLTLLGSLHQFGLAPPFQERPGRKVGRGKSIPPLTVARGAALGIQFLALSRLGRSTLGLLPQPLEIGYESVDLLPVEGAPLVHGKGRHAATPCSYGLYEEGFAFLPQELGISETDAFHLVAVLPVAGHTPALENGLGVHRPGWGACQH